MSNQSVIKADTERTRNKLIHKHEKFDFELLLTFYCKETGIYYKQGMNEVLAPFMLFSKCGLSLCLVYKMYKKFISRFLQDMFSDEEFTVLESQFILFRLILRYCDPELCFFLGRQKIGPELFSAPWFVTLFSSKINEIDCLYDL